MGTDNCSFEMAASTQSEQGQSSSPHQSQAADASAAKEQGLSPFDAELLPQLQALSKFVHDKDASLISRILRSLSKLRRLATQNTVLRALLLIDASPEPFKTLLDAVPSCEDGSQNPKELAVFCSKFEASSYVSLVAVLFLLDHKKHNEAYIAADTLVKRLEEKGDRMLDAILARAYFYLSLASERNENGTALRPRLMAAY